MPRLSSAQEEARQQVLRIAQSGCLPEQFGSRLLAALELAVPNDGQRLFGVDPDTLLFNRLLAASPGDEPFRLRWLRDTYLQHEPIPYVSPPLVMRIGLTTVIFRHEQDLCWGIPSPILDQVSARAHRHVFYDHLTPVGGSLRTCFAVEGRTIGMLNIVRREASRPLQPTDAAFLRRLAPTISRALTAAFAREQALLQNGITTTHNASGIVVLEPDRRVRFATPAGEAWLAELRDAHRDGHGPLPTAVWSAAAGLQAAGTESVASTVIASALTGPVRVEASPGGDDGSIAVVMTPVRPPMSPDIPYDWPLTRQERQVVSLLAKGLSNRQIAEALTVSEHTIETHLGHAYDKLDVRGRSQLMARLFHELYLPSFGVPHHDEEARIVEQAPRPYADRYESDR